MPDALALLNMNDACHFKCLVWVVYDGTLLVGLQPKLSGNRPWCTVLAGLHKHIYRGCNDTAHCARFLFCINASCLFSTCPKRALVWGNCCERLHVEIFLRVLRSSRVNLSTVNDTNVFCFVWIESPFIYFLLQSSILCYKSSVGNKVQFLVESF